VIEQTGCKDGGLVQLVMIGARCDLQQAGKCEQLVKE
jgi:hypothetical protein